MPRQFQDIVPDLASDGSLRDFYVFGASAFHWNRFLGFVRLSIRDDCFRVDTQVSPLPSTFEDIFALRATASPCLSVPVGDGFLCCHFFSDSEIELDFRPEDYRTPPRWAALCAFLQDLVDIVGLPGIVTPENQETEVIERFEPRGRGEEGAPGKRRRAEQLTDL
ncbi:MAG TPA: hypothetical protein VN578_10885 [Candidatus Binatia bacterium]|nr:hypothetical protein [Candidatus Binatia bacterium]